MVEASLLKRFLSVIADLLFINLTVAYPLNRVLDQFVPKQGFSELYSLVSSSSYLQGVSLLIMFAFSLVAFFYFSFFEAYLGQTPGMMLFRLKVVSEKGNLTLGRCMLRSLFVFPFFPFYLLWFLEPLFLLYRGKRLTEIFTNTKVIEAVPIDLSSWSSTSRM